MMEHPTRRVHFAGLSMLTLASMLAGCSNTEEPKPVQTSETKVPATPVQSVAPAAPNVENTPLYAHLHQSYSEAVTESTPDNVRRPPDETAAGKKTAEIWRLIKGENGSGGLWEQIRFLTPQGKRISYEALVKTSFGEFHIELLPDAAPNHVRNFIALARAGYYDGLGVDHIIKEKDSTWTVLAAGCPLGTDEAD